MAVSYFNEVTNRYRCFTRMLVIGYILLTWGLITDWWIWKSLSGHVQANTPRNTNLDKLQHNSVLKSHLFHPEQADSQSEKLESELLKIAGYTKGKGSQLILTGPEPEGEHQLQEADLEIAYRVKRVKDLCKKYHMGQYRSPNSWSNDLQVRDKWKSRYETDYFFLLRKWGFSYCPVYKAGSTSMFHNLLLLGGVPKANLTNLKEDVINLAIRMYAPQSNDRTCATSKAQAIEKSVKLLVVRHPFERLLSLFLDKFANSTIRHEDATLIFYNIYGKNIVKKYRSNSSSLTQIEPIWPEFVEYILTEDWANDHWRPVFLTCTPCLVNYDIIAKLETFSRDQAYFIRKLDLDTLKGPSWQHKVKNSTEEKRKNTAQTYYGQLTKNQIKGLVKKYLMDFLLFDYSPDEYIAYGRDS